MNEVLLHGLVLATAMRVFTPDAARLVRRALAAGVRVGTASLPDRRPPLPAAPVPAPAGAVSPFPVPEQGEQRA
ncbi:hypothetical protein KBZ10_11590 [Streptomyces sp. F63]|uniref:hypothetical protein n=1 Tax=Streptomyces sp. F63 TaxID=2824887 RepID=UPI001B3743C7|nr:hypothetical protein [Streptomyces sp. F63]MBQ0985152.1 hypothetical protein [Streptomyces sp. F63]